MITFRNIHTVMCCNTRFGVALFDNMLAMLSHILRCNVFDLVWSSSRENFIGWGSVWPVGPKFAVGD